MKKYASVIVDIASSQVDKIFDYTIGELEVSIGSLVVVPFGNRNISGFVIDIKDETAFDKDKIKQIKSVTDFCITPQHIKLASYMADEFFLRQIDALRLLLPPSVRKGVKIRKKKSADFCLDIKPKSIVLTQEQENAAKIIEQAAKPVLLFGITGCGKTEVYLQAIEQVLNSGKQAIMLVPEISLTPQIFARFKDRFGDSVAILHSGLSMTEKRTEFYKIYDGTANVVVGARSAIFAPVKNLGIVIIDEEHDGSYISESNPRYNCHAVAKKLVELFDAKLVFGSATPSVQSFLQAKNGVYELAKIKNRIDKSKLPDIEIVDMQKEIYNGNSGIFSALAINKLQETIEQKKQAVVFINRRGYSSFVRCFECGYIPHCEACAVSLVFHKEDRQLKCHFCGKRYKVVNTCEKCGGTMRYGAVGTQQIVEQLKKHFGGQLSVFRLDHDVVNNDKSQYIKVLNEFAGTKPAILVGTQMVAKGHDFDDIVLSVIVDADVSLFNNDFRSAERTYSLCLQVAGRAGRKDDASTCILQTYMPRHFVYTLAKTNDFEGFFEREIKMRQAAALPPYSTIVRVLVCSEDEEIAKAKTAQIWEQIEKLPSELFIYKEVMKSPIKRLKNKFRFQVLMRVPNNDNAKQTLAAVNAIAKSATLDATVFVEQNPQNLS